MLLPPSFSNTLHEENEAENGSPRCWGIISCSRAVGHHRGTTVVRGMIPAEETLVLKYVWETDVNGSLRRWYMSKMC